MTRYYKFLNPERRPIYGTGQWPEPGTWAPEIVDVVPCQSGYHACTVDQLANWAGPELWEVEYDQPPQILDDKVVGRRARLVRRIDRWNDTTQRLFAADCAEHVLPLFEAERPGDDRPRYAVEVARLYAAGRSDATELAAARDAAWAAAEAAWAAAWAARAAAWTAWAAAGAARAAAWTAWVAGDAARAAAWTAGVAGDAARAARAAASERDAAWTAASERDAAWTAARAAGAAAHDAERAWQTGRLVHHTRIET